MAAPAGRPAEKRTASPTKDWKAAPASTKPTPATKRPAPSQGHGKASSKASAAPPPASRTATPAASSGAAPTTLPPRAILSPIDPSVPDPPSAVLAADIPPQDPAATKKSRGATAWHILLGIDLGLFALAILGSLYLFFFPSESASEQAEAAAADPGSIYLNSAVILIMAGLIPFGWVMGTRVVSWAGTVRYLGLQEPIKRLGIGAAWGFALLGMILVFATLLSFADDSLGTNSTENPQLEAMLDVITWPMAFWIAFAASVGEEILFRGILQKWIGFWGQAIVFGFAHASYGTPLQIIVPFAIGLLFGWFVKRGQGILVPMAAHFVYDFTVASSPLWLEGGI